MLVPLELCHVGVDQRREQPDRGRPLQADRRDLGGPVDQLGVLDTAPHPGDVLLGRRGVDDDQEAVWQAVNEDVVDDAATLVQQQRILCPADL